ncbi:alpha/beta hydrolase [bacterium]|nr:alpha/beta hydrolase [bacterium]
MNQLILTILLIVAAAAAVTFSACDILEPEAQGQLVPLTVDEDPSLPSIEVNGTLLHAETFGNPTDPMLVILHGGPGGDYRSMLKLAAFADDGFFVVFYDQRGCGLSRRHGREMYDAQGPDLAVADLRAVIGHYRSSGQKVLLMGQSWGAMLASAYINDYPEDISGAILMEPGGLTWPDTKEYLERWQIIDPFDETLNDRVFVDQIITGSDHVKLDYKAAIQGAAEYAEGNKLGIAGPTPFWRMGGLYAIAASEYATEHSFDFTTNLQKYDKPVLFAYSELNQAYGRSHAELVSSAFPNVQLVEILGTGHSIPSFGWDNLYPIAKAYLNTVR